MKIVDFVGYSGSGKTSLIEQLVTLFTAKGLRVSCIKNAHHGFQMDKPGKDSYRFQQAGASQVIVRTDDSWALLSKTEKPASLAQLIGCISDCDLLIVEGFKSEAENILKIEVRRDGVSSDEPIYLHDRQIAAVVTDEQSILSDLPRLDINDIQALALWLSGKLDLKGA